MPTTIHAYLVLVVLAAASAPRVSISRPTAKSAKPAKSLEATKIAQPKALADALSGEEKVAAIQSIASEAGTNLTTKRVFRVGIRELTDGVGLDLHARLFRWRGEAAPPVLTTTRVGMSIPAVPGGVYMFDCGVENARSYEFTIFESGFSLAGGTASSVNDRLLFAHAFRGDENSFLMVNVLGTKATEKFAFSSCEVTELAPRVPETKKSVGGSTGTMAR